MTKRNVIILITILAVIGAATFFLKEIKDPRLTAEPIFPSREQKITPLDPLAIEKISAHLENLSPYKPALGGKWQIRRFSVVDKKHLYVEYEDGHKARRLLLEERGNDWKVLGFFKPGRDMWELVSGKDPYFGAKVTIYERDQAGKWHPI